MLQNLNLTLHEIQERLPSVLVGHVVTPSTASRDRQVSTHIFEAMGLSLRPVEVEEDCDLPVEERNKSKWTFRWNWIPVEGNDRVLERTEWGPVLQFVRGLGLDAHDVSEEQGQHCVEKLLYNSEIYSPRSENPLHVRRQRVFLRHRVKGQTDLVILDITRQMVKVAIETKKWQGLAILRMGACSRRNFN